MPTISGKIKHILKIIRGQLILSLYDCDGMCNHCPKDYQIICQTFKNHPMQKKDPRKMLDDATKAGIPVFVLVAKDKLSVEALNAYWVACDLESCDPSHIVGVQEILTEFERWQHANHDKVKLPD